MKKIEEEEGIVKNGKKEKIPGYGGAFLRVRYADKYVIGQIHSFREGKDVYRVE